MGKFNRKLYNPTEDEDYDYYKGNPYYSPESCGLEIYTFTEKEPNYDFDMFVVFKDKATGELFAAHDSGCSCPTPFEDFASLEQMTRLKKIEDFDKFVDANWILSGDYSGHPKDEVRKARQKVQRYLKKRNEAVQFLGKKVN